MESSEKVIKWSIDNSEKLSLKAEFYTGIQQYLKNIFDIGIFITVDRKEYYGRGSDYCETKAYLKAFSEVVERASLDIFDIEMTNGLAAHSILSEARKNAKYELIERDAFLCKYLLKAGFRKIENLHEDLVSLLRFKKIHINFYEMCSYREGVGILCILNGADSALAFGNIMGTSYNESIETASMQALIEALRSFTRLDNKKNISIDNNTFKEIEKPSFLDHGYLSLNLDYSLSFNEMLDNPIILLRDETEEADFFYNKYNFVGTVFDGLPLYLVKARNSKLQSLFTGQTKSSCINWNRLNSIKPNLTFQDINPLPHPFD